MIKVFCLAGCPRGTLAWEQALWWRMGEKKGRREERVMGCSNHHPIPLLTCPKERSTLTVAKLSKVDSRDIDLIIKNYLLIGILLKELEAFIKKNKDAPFQSCPRYKEKFGCYH